MPVHPTKKDTTSNPSSSTQEQTTPPLPDQQAFQQYLREKDKDVSRPYLEERSKGE